MTNEKILVIGAGGQIGSVLIQQLAHLFGKTNIIASDLRAIPKWDGYFELLNVLDQSRLEQVVRQYHIKQIYHLAAILSAKGEENPLKTWEINMSGLFNVLETARKFELKKVFYPSSIAVFGEDAPAKNTPQNTFLNPSTVYGMSKAAGENWGQYYVQKYNLDVRSLRYPGIIGHESMPGGGTTDYAVEIYHQAVKGENYRCFLRKDSLLPMIYMRDAIRGTIELMQAPKSMIKTRTSYNLASMSFTPMEVAQAIQQHFPDFQVQFEPDFRQKIADSWPNSIDDSLARKDWGWQPEFDLEKMTADMIFHLKKQYRPALQV